MRDASPLRYPGGKWRLARFFGKLIDLNFERRPAYLEPYAGGGSLALSLLFSNYVSEIFLNDLDPAVYAFWSGVLSRTEEFVQLIETTAVTPEQWRRQKETYSRGLAVDSVRLGFATFYLNRTNHSGILNGGMIGGKRQLGEWRVDARFNRSELIRRVRRIASYSSRIHLSRLDALEFIKYKGRGRNKLIYFDPPYYGAGRHLYLNAYKPADHETVRDRVSQLGCHWVVSYDNVPQIKALYRDYRSRRVQLLHTARIARQGSELMFFSPSLAIPRRRRSIRTSPIWD
jgi:DNA adenine methylase